MPRPRSLALVLSITALLAVLGASPARASGRDLTGQPAPEIYVPLGYSGLPSGASLASYRGHVVVIKFFFTGCPTCRASLPEFESLWRRYGPRGVVFIALAYDSASNVMSYWPRNGLTVPVGIDEGGVSAGRYGVTTYPTNYVVGADGYVKSYESMADWILERELAAAASVPTAAPVEAPPAGAAARDARIRELGDVPAALTPVKDAAAENDYGAVLRIVEKHLASPGEAANVMAASRRIRDIALEHAAVRLSRIEGAWAAGDRRGAYDRLLHMVDDFRGTEYGTGLAQRAKRVAEALGLPPR
jgi:peroxiredoxin